jgi:hypothetical protein
LSQRKTMSASRVVGLAVVAILLLTLPALTQRKIQRSEPPPSRREDRDGPNSDWESSRLSREKENGQVFYQAELTVNGHSKDVLIDSTGVIVEVEEQVAMDSLPSAVRCGPASQGRKRRQASQGRVADETQPTGGL